MTSSIKSISGRAIPLLLDDIDTDRIIPARYLRCVTFDGIGEHAFEDDRQQDPGHPMNDVRFQGASILVAGRNFGCGSSREHAPQALLRWGIRAIVAESFAEIFFGNCISLGIVPVSASRAKLQQLSAAVRQQPELPLTVDLQSRTLSAGPLVVDVEIPDSARDALLLGRWDFLGQLLEAADQTRRVASQLPYLSRFVNVRA